MTLLGSPSPRWRDSLLPVASLLLASACSPHKVNPEPAPPVDVPESFGGEAAEGEMVDRWWTDFDDPHLDRMVASALSGSFRLRAAWARVRQAEAAIGQARAARWPQADGTVNAQRGTSFFPPLGTITQESYTLSLPVSYELDLWRKYGSGVDSAAAQARASRDDLEATAMSLAAEVAEAWFDVVAARALDDLLREQLEVNEDSEELLEGRFARGLAAAVDVYQQRTQAINTRVEIETNLGELETAQNRLSILLGKPIDQLSIPAVEELPEVPNTPNLGVPADLLERRPDLRASREQLVAEDHLLAQAIAERLPTLLVSARIGFSGSTPRELLDNLIRSIAGDITVPLIDGGRRAAAQRAQEARVDEALATYGETLLNAIVEVENALALEVQQEKTVQLLEAALETAKAALREANARYVAGVDTYLPVLTANASMQDSQRALIDARRQRLSLRIQLFRALGGTWTAALERPDGEKESS